MFGYIKPLKGELKVREYEKYKAVYCGLCHKLSSLYGRAARFTVNFDFTFMAMLLSEVREPGYCHRKCLVSPFKKRCFVLNDPALDTTAAFSIILTYWKLRDNVRDEGFLKSIVAKMSILIILRAYKKARQDAPGFDILVRESLVELNSLERDYCDSIDKTADKFARILEGACKSVADNSRQRVLSQIFYHTGRIVYLLDAIDDLPRDFKEGSYNPLISRFKLKNGELSADNRKTVEITMSHSSQLLCSAFELLDSSPWEEILANIVYLGIPWVTEKILSGEWKKQGLREA